MPDNEFASEKNLIERDETRALISSDKVEGTRVYNGEGEKLGSIHHMMIGKYDGQVRYAVMSFGGLFGMGEDFYPLPWNRLTYDTDREGYVVAVTKDQLNSDAMPGFARHDAPEWNADFDERIRVYWL
ncbi:MAG: PRC-barrel domain containing protein [Sphingomonadales bacterium]|nr:PRC-barrel domain containing protein [Sphingomonadales bacterium]